MQCGIKTTINVLQDEDRSDRPVCDLDDHSSIEEQNSEDEYLLLTEFEVRTVSYGPSFFPFAYGPSAKRAGHKLMGKTRIHNLQYGLRKRGK